jgi:flagellar assembly protein FliH
LIKAVFRYGEINPVAEKIQIEPPHMFPELSHPAEPVETKEPDKKEDAYEGPTSEDLRKEAEAFKVQWAVEKEALILSAKMEADGIIKAAEDAAFQEVKRKTEEAQIIKRQAEDDAEAILANANQKASELESSARAAFESQKKEAREQGFQAGREEGFNIGKAEAERLIQRTQVVLERAQHKRAEILAETEQQIIDLVLLISRKVVKVISETQRQVIISNVVQALRKIKGKGAIIIRVNMADVKLTTEHIKDFIRLAEGAASIQVQEDSSVDHGGCVIETDFGEIDARISSQLAELESKILEISPIKTKPKETAKTG